MRDIEWRKSSHSIINGECVEFAFVNLHGGYRAVRDSKDASGTVLTFAPEEWSAFVAGIHAGEFD